MAVELKKIGWEDGTLVSNAKVEIDGTIYEVTPEQYSGSTPLSAENLKQMETNTENAINESDTNIENLINGTVLYEGTTHVTNGTLNDDIANYKRIKIWARSTDNHCVCQEMLLEEWTGNNLITSLWSGSMSDRWYFYSSRIIITNNTFTLDREKSMVISGSTITSTSADAYTIYKIIGYKY